MADVTETFPWQTPPEQPARDPVQEAIEALRREPARDPVQEAIEALRRDFAFAVRMTAVKVLSNNPEFEAVINTDRGQPVPGNVAKFNDGTTVQFVDMGMCQPNSPYMTVPEIAALVLAKAAELGLELES